MALTLGNNLYNPDSAAHAQRCLEDVRMRLDPEMETDPRWDGAG